MDNRNEAIQYATLILKSDILQRAMSESYYWIEDKDGKLHASEDLKNDARSLMDSVSDPDAIVFDLLKGIAADLLRNNGRLPPLLASFAADVLEGKRTRPTKRGADKNKNLIRDFYLWVAVMGVAIKFDLPKYTNNEMSCKTNAAEIVAEASGLNVDVVIKAYKAYKGFNWGAK